MRKSVLDLEYCSEHLRTLRRQLADHRHGGVVLDSEQVEGIVNHLDEAIAMALNLEFAISNDLWNRRAAEDRAKLMTPSSVVVLNAFRDGSNVVPFPRGRA
ncbi:hypothetical protein [Neorhizobium petrolearium]|uniref:hypothetical protein n=1 Tax=Neorhizobium petrolearium TaxID=515361 RepID=UPI003F81BA42